MHSKVLDSCPIHRHTCICTTTQIHTRNASKITATAASIRLLEPWHFLEIGSVGAAPAFVPGLEAVLFLLLDTARYFETFCVAACCYRDKGVERTSSVTSTRRLRFLCHGGDSKRETVVFDEQDPFAPMLDAVATESCLDSR